MSPGFLFSMAEGRTGRRARADDVKNPRCGVRLSGDEGERERCAGSVSIFVSCHTGFQRHQAFPDVDGQIDSLVQSPKFRQHFVTK